MRSSSPVVTIARETAHPSEVFRLRRWPQCLLRGWRCLTVPSSNPSAAASIDAFHSPPRLVSAARECPCVPPISCASGCSTARAATQTHRRLALGTADCRRLRQLSILDEWNVDALERCFDSVRRSRRGRRCYHRRERLRNRRRWIRHRKYSSASGSSVTVCHYPTSRKPEIAAKFDLFLVI